MSFVGWRARGEGGELSPFFLSIVGFGILLTCRRVHGDRIGCNGGIVIE